MNVNEVADDFVKMMSEIGFSNLAVSIKDADSNSFVVTTESEQKACELRIALKMLNTSFTHNKDSVMGDSFVYNDTTGSNYPSFTVFVVAKKPTFTCAGLPVRDMLKKHGCSDEDEVNSLLNLISQYE